jgi:hypothetical protein
VVVGDDDADRLGHPRRYLGHVTVTRAPPSG